MKSQIIELIGCTEQEIIEASAKSGKGIKDIFDAIISRIDPPENNINSNSRALIFDSIYDNYRGAIAYVRVNDGILKSGMTAKFFAHGKEYEITETGYFILDKIKTAELKSGDVGYVVAGVRDMSHIQPGDTITTKESKAQYLSGYKEVKPMVFSGLYPADTDQYNQLKTIFRKIKVK